MATTVTIDSTAHGTHSSLGSNANALTISTGGANRLIFLVINCTTGATVSSISGIGTWTKQGVRTGTSNRVELWTLSAPTQVTSVSVTVNLSGTTTSTIMSDAVYLSAGATSVPTISAAPNPIESDTSPFTGSITTVYNFDQVLAWCCSSASDTITPGTGYTSTGAGAGTLNIQGEIANAYTSTPTTVAPTFTGTALAGQVVCIAVNGPLAAAISSITIGADGKSWSWIWSGGAPPLSPTSGITGFSASVPHGSITFSSVNSSSSTVTATGSIAVWGTDVCTSTYAPGNLVDTNGTAVTPFSGHAVTNNSTLPTFGSLGQYL